MIKKLVYDSTKLMELLGKEYFLQKLDYTKEYTEDYDDCGIYKSETYFITSLTNIKKIYSSFWTFGSDTKIFLDDGKEILLSSGTYEGRNDILNRTKNKILSKPITIRGKFIEVCNELNDWLIFNGVSAKDLKKLRIELSQEQTYKFPFYDVIFDNETNQICGTNYKQKLTIKEKDLMKAILEIEDKRTAYKIQYILKKVNDLQIIEKNN